MAELRIISPDELQEILVGHQRWLESEGKEGRRANLGLANLQNVDLSGANLQEAFLAEANLQKSDLGRGNLRKADLIGAKLQNANLGRADLQGANLNAAPGLTALQVKKAMNWKLAYYDNEFLRKNGKELGLPRSYKEHTSNVRKKLAGLEKKKKKAATKK